MKYFNYNTQSSFFLFFELIITFQLILRVSPELNNIIRLSDNNFIYNHISINSNGDMVIDTSSLTSKDRKFYGLKQNGSPFFGSSPYETLSVNRDVNYGRSEGQVLFIKYSENNDYSNIKECLAFIPQTTSRYVEYYFFDQGSINDYETNSENFGGILSSYFSALKFREGNDTDFEYVFSYKFGTRFTVSQGYFDTSNFYFYKSNNYFQVLSTNNFEGMMISCYFTKSMIYTCFYLQAAKYNGLCFRLPLANDNKHTTELFAIEDDEDDSRYQTIFYKGIHIKEELGAFLFYKSINDKFATIQLYKVYSISLKEYLGEININQYSFNYDQSLNDFIKLNDQQICYISTSEAKMTLYIIIVTLYDSDTEFSVKYYLQNMNDIYNIVFYRQIISNLYNDFLTIAFSHSIGSDYGSSFIFIGYPNSTDHSYNIISEISSKQLTIDKLSFYLDETLKIENNLFNYEFFGTKIKYFTEGLEIYLDNKIISRNSFLLKDKFVKVNFLNTNGLYKAKTYVVKIAYVVKETENADITTYTQKNFTGKYSNFSFVLNNDIYCQEDTCFSCDESLTHLTGTKEFDINIYKLNL